MKKMRYLFLTLTLLSLTNYSNLKFLKLNGSFYEVYKIDSLNNYYLIYALKNDKRFKIVSIKSDTEKCNNIYVGGYYQFNLTSVYQNLPFAPVNQTEIYLAFDDSTAIRPEPENGVYDLYFGDNIKGLCQVDDGK